MFNDLCIILIWTMGIHGLKNYVDEELFNEYTGVGKQDKPGPLSLCSKQLNSDNNGCVVFFDIDQTLTEGERNLTPNDAQTIYKTFSEIKKKKCDIILLTAGDIWSAIGLFTPAEDFDVETVAYGTKFSNDVIEKHVFDEKKEYKSVSKKQFSNTIFDHTDAIKTQFVNAYISTRYIHNNDQGYADAHSPTKVQVMHMILQKFYKTEGKEEEMWNNAYFLDDKIDDHKKDEITYNSGYNTGLANHPGEDWWKTNTINVEWNHYPNNGGLDKESYYPHLKALLAKLEEQKCRNLSREYLTNLTARKSSQRHLKVSTDSNKELIKCLSKPNASQPLKIDLDDYYRNI